MGTVFPTVTALSYSGLSV